MLKKMIIESYPPQPSKLNLGLKALVIAFPFSATSALATLPVAQRDVVNAQGVNKALFLSVVAPKDVF